MDASPSPRAAAPVLPPGPTAPKPAAPLPSAQSAERRRATTSRQSAIRAWLRDFRRAA